MHAKHTPDLESGPATDVAAPESGDLAGQSARVTRFLAELRGFADGPAPAPSAELAALLGGAIPLRPSTGGGGAHKHRNRRRNTAMAAAVGLTALSLTGVAAANDSLPQPAQRVVSSVVNDLTPFHIDPSRVPRSPSLIVPPPAPTRSSGHDDQGSGEGSSTEPTGPGPSRSGEDAGGSSDQGGSGDSAGEYGAGTAQSAGGAGSDQPVSEQHPESPTAHSSEHADEHHDSSAPAGGEHPGD